ncbi:MAG TPA: hypothetical protein ENJ95_24200 [Bacteroidetes bacterium]|nr:hypothetical protein [Bacteroidota bacterium]
MKNTKCPFEINLRCQLNSLFLRFFFLLFIPLIIPLNILGNGTDWAQGLTITYTSVAVSLCGLNAANCFELRVDNIPLNVNPAGEKKGYSCFWYFGDGSYFISNVDSTDTHASIFHEFRTNALSGIYLQLAKRYDDDEKPAKIILQGGPPTIQNYQPQKFLPDLIPTNIKLIHSLDPRPGDISTYVISYQIPDRCKDFDGNVIIHLGYSNNGKVTITGTPKIYGASGFLINTQPTYPTNGVLEFSVQTLSNTNRINAFVDFDFSNIQLGEAIHFDVEMRPEQDSATCLTGTIENDLDLIAVKSHDPNKIISNLLSVCPDYSGNIEYTVVFQNIGNGPANIVYIKNILPDYFRYTEADIQTIAPSGLSKELPLNSSTREIEWVLSTANGLLKDGYSVNELKGTGQSGYEIGSVNEHYTKDSIVFMVTLDASKHLPQCGVIPNRAQIFFDNNSPIVTKNFYTQIKCDNCNGCDTIGAINKAPPMFLNRNQPINISSLPFDEVRQNQNHVIYPKAKINKMLDGTSEAVINSPGIHTLVSTSGCFRSITEIPVYDQYSYPITIEDCNWWTCELTIKEEGNVDPLSYIWNYYKNGKHVTSVGNKLNFTGVDSAQVMVRLSDGRSFIHMPCVLCWKNIAIKYWWCILIAVFLLVYLAIRPKIKN